MLFRSVVRFLPLLALLVLSGSNCSLRAQGLSDKEFEELSLKLSEDNGFFPTDNLVSNETSYLHVLPQIKKYVEPGGVYIGVGPEQNFSYIAAAKPALVFIVDIRRDNLLQHLWLKSLFISSDNRAEFMAQLFARPLPRGFKAGPRSDAHDLAQIFSALPGDKEYFESTIEKLWKVMHGKFPNLTAEEDRRTVERIASAFHRKGLDLAYEIPGRPELNARLFPSWGSLMVQTDLEGRTGHYLDRDESFNFLKKLAEENRLIPVVGNLAGGKALRTVGQEVRRRGLQVSLLYLSNVEFYLFRNGTMEFFIDNVGSMPVADSGILIRSYFNRLTGYRDIHPESVPGHLSVSLVQNIQNFLRIAEEEPYRNYWDLVARDYIPISRPGFPENSDR
ncbi:MAG TPA: hypothetical protein VLU25_03010 [Acidobacteriota bacterium]|nr:hypothetical protein [Acidobacteriota bacterium]